MTDRAEASQDFGGNQAQNQASQHNGNVNGNVYYSKTIESIAGKAKKTGLFSLDRLLNEGRNSKDLIEAARDGKLNRVEHLLEHEYVDINYTIDRPAAKGLSALHEASYRGHHHVACLLLQPWVGADAGLQASEDSYSPLMSAAIKGQNELVTLLLQKGAALEARILRPGLSYDNALTMAISRRHYPTVQLLLNQGANPNAQLGKYHGAARVPMHTAVLSGPEYVEVLLNHDAHSETLFFGADLSFRKGLSNELFSLLDVAWAYGWETRYVKKIKACGVLTKLPNWDAASDDRPQVVWFSSQTGNAQGSNSTTVFVEAPEPEEQRPDLSLEYSPFFSAYPGISKYFSRH